MPQISYWGYGPDPANRGDEAGRWTTDSVANIPSNASAITIDGQHVNAVDSDAGTRTKPAYMSQADYDYSTSKIFSAGGRSFVPEDVADYIGKKYQAQLGSSDSFLDKAIPIAVMAIGGALTGGGLLEAFGATAGTGGLGFSGLADGGFTGGAGGGAGVTGAGGGGSLAEGGAGVAGGAGDASWGINQITGATGGAGGGGSIAEGGVPPPDAPPPPTQSSIWDSLTNAWKELPPGTGTAAQLLAGGGDGSEFTGGATPDYAPAGGGTPGTTGADPFVTGATGGAASGAASSALSRLMNGEATAADYASLLGTFGSTALGLLGANAQSGALKDVYNQQMALGAPSRARYEASFAPGWNIATADPSFTTGLDAGASAAARAVSAKSGNPAQNPGAMSEIQDYITGKYIIPQTNTYRSINASAGQLGVNQAGTAALTGAGNASDPYSAIASGLGSLTRPDNSLSSLLKQLQGLPLSYGTTPP